VHTGTAATASDARNLQPDVLLLAAGGRHEVPDIPGIDRRKVLTGEQLHHLVKLALEASTPACCTVWQGAGCPWSARKSWLIAGGYTTVRQPNSSCIAAAGSRSSTPAPPS
jgi:hypothetical protein